MEIPPELRRIPPPAALEWVAGCVGPQARVSAVRRLPNAWAAAMHAVDVDDADGERHELVLRRWARADQPPDPGVVENEAAALSILASVSEPRAPRLVAADPTGSCAGVPAVVMTRLPGRDELAPPDVDAFLDGMVSTLHAIHGLKLAPGALDDYRPWGLGAFADPPPWSRRPEVWRRAFDIARNPVPEYPAVLCHRDFHPGNVLWHDARVTGVIDWTHACRGPAAADVAHCRLNLALLFGAEVADAFSSRYGRIDDLAWFDLVDVVGFGTLDAWRWHDAGRPDITLETLRQAFDDFLAAAVDRLS
jgi:aminoglycoside phosphotransferase (APT) family kinase protein